MITEDYCSYELSKLLKEKGFDVSWCDRGWDISCYDVKQSRMFSHGYDNKDNWIEQPTLSLAMKWLREVHRKYIDIRYNNQNEEYRFIVFTMVKDKPIDFIHSEYHSTYEEAVEAAIKYCLTNLINNETN